MLHKYIFFLSKFSMNPYNYFPYHTLHTAKMAKDKWSWTKHESYPPNKQLVGRFIRKN